MEKNKPFKAILVLLSVTLLLFSACNKKKVIGKKDRSAGGTSEILIVTQNDEQWNGMIGDTIRAFFLQPQYGLPQPEAIKKLAHLNVIGFTDMFKRFKCILIVEIDPNIEKPVVETGEDLWAAPQRVIKIIAPDRTSWCQTFNEQKEVYRMMFDKVERDRIMTVLRPSNDTKITQRIKEKMGFDMTIPSGFFIAKDEPDFMWLRKELEKNSFGIFIYTTPYKDTLQLELNSLVSVRDLMLQKYVPGPADGSFMTTEKEFVPPLVSYISTYPTGFAAEIRGMWCLVGDYMAGPFVSYTFPDEKTGNLVTLEGYVYYPNHDKRDDLLQLQSILYSIKTEE
ncbi:MAG: DUF4837 family protein [Bacteroidales bacterium]|nr:DUF4837 family protein [Bacteroidales bacterium]